MADGLRIPLRSQNVVLTANGSGIASGSITGVVGDIIGVGITLGASMTTLALTVTADVGDVVINGVTVTANKVIPVRRPAVTNDGSTAITSSSIPYMNAGGAITAAIASATTTKTVTITVYYR